MLLQLTLLKTSFIFCLAALLGQPLTATELPGNRIPDGWGVQLKGHCNEAADLDQVKAAGLTWVRHGFHWGAIEKEKGVYDYGDYERFVKDCHARGLKIVGVVALQNKALYPHPKDDPGTTAYANYAAALVTHFKDYDIAWEIWNEPNTMTFWGKHGKGNSKEFAEEYYRMTKAAVTAMKQANPDCVILGGSVSNMWSKSYEWMDFAFQAGILKLDLDGWSVHPYGLKTPEDYVEAYAITRDLMKKNGGPELPLLNTERGFPLGKKEGYAGGSKKQATEYQAWHGVRQFLIDKYLGCNMTIWYEWYNRDKVKGFSLYGDGKSPPLPVYDAVQVLFRELDGYSIKERVKLQSDRDFALLLENGEGKRKLAVWSSPPAMESPDKNEEHSVEIPVDASGSLELTDLFGKKSSIDVENGEIKIELSGAVQYIAL
jgi:hypothetical protein